MPFLHKSTGVTRGSACGVFFMNRPRLFKEPSPKVFSEFFFKLLVEWGSGPNWLLVRKLATRLDGDWVAKA